MIWNLIGSIGGKILDIVDDVIEGKGVQAAFWKQHYNMALGKGTVNKYVYKVQNSPQRSARPLSSAIPHGSYAMPSVTRSSPSNF